MTAILFATLLIWTLSTPSEGSLSERRGDEDPMSCHTSSGNTIKTIQSASYEALVDYNYHSDDHYIRCQKPISLKHQDKMTMPVPFDEMAKKMERVSAYLAEHHALRKRQLVIYAYSESNTVSLKISSLLKSELFRKKVAVLESEPALSLLRLNSGNLQGLKSQCMSGKYNLIPEVARVFAVRSEASNSQLKLGLCHDETWEVLL